MNYLNDLPVTTEEFEYILQKPVLSHEDLRKFNAYRDESAELLSFGILEQIYKRVIQNNDVDGWEILSQYEYYAGFQPPFDVCLELAIRYGNYDIFAHILNAYASYDKLEYGDPIRKSRLRALAHENPNKDVNKVVEHLIAMIPGTKLTEDFAEEHKDEIRYLLGYEEVKEPDLY